jgi:hypothetical protein
MTKKEETITMPLKVWLAADELIGELCFSKELKPKRPKAFKAAFKCFAKWHSEARNLNKYLSQRVGRVRDDRWPVAISLDPKGAGPRRKFIRDDG